MFNKFSYTLHPISDLVAKSQVERMERSDPHLINAIESKLDQSVAKFMIDADTIIASNIKQTNIIDDFLKPLKRFAYIFGNNYYLFYQIDNKIYVDIQHVISNLGLCLDEYKHKYHDFSEFITNSLWDVRFDGTLVRRELIDFHTMGRLILSVDSEFTRTFRLQCALYLVCLLVVFICSLCILALLCCY